MTRGADPESETGTWLGRLAIALDDAAPEEAAPRGDIEWLVLRCRDTQGFAGDLRLESLRHLVLDLGALLRTYPTAIPRQLLDIAKLAPGNALHSSLLRAEALALSTAGAPRWNSVFVTGPLALSPEGLVLVGRSDLVSADDFSGRFAQLLARGHPWINVSAMGVLHGDLLVAIETSPQTTPDLQTSVNVSGPQAFVQQRPGWSLDGLLSVEEDP